MENDASGLHLPSLTAGLDDLKSTLSTIVSDKSLSAAEKLFYISKYLNALQYKTAIPTMMALRVLLLNHPEKRRALETQLARSAALTALPQIIARLANNYDDVSGARNKTKALQELVPKSLVDTGADLAPSILYHMGSQLG